MDDDLGSHGLQPFRADVCTEEGSEEEKCVGERGQEHLQNLKWEYENPAGVFFADGLVVFRCCRCWCAVDVS